MNSCLALDLRAEILIIERQQEEERSIFYTLWLECKLVGKKKKKKRTLQRTIWQDLGEKKLPEQSQSSEYILRK